MKFDPDIHHRRSIRLRDYDYARAGAYFVTVCVQHRECLFGDVEDSRMVLNDAGDMVNHWWMKLPEKFANTRLDQYSIMPNHFHGIILIVGADPCVRPGSNTDPCVRPGSDAGVCGSGQNHYVHGRMGGHAGPPLPSMVQWFKTMTTNAYIHAVNRHNWPSFPGRLWQRNYFERVIRNDVELHQARDYIEANPSRWETDDENPVNHP